MIQFSNYYYYMYMNIYISEMAILANESVYKQPFQEMKVYRNSHFSKWKCIETAILANGSGYKRPFQQVKVYVLSHPYASPHAKLYISETMCYSQQAPIVSNTNVSTISDNCVRKSTLWFSGQSVGLQNRRSWVEFHQQRGLFSSAICLCL